MFRNTLFAKLFFLLVVSAALLVPSIYYFTVPLVDQHIYQIEERSGKTTLNTIFTLLEHTRQDLSAWEEYSLASHKRSIHDIVAIAANELGRIWDKYAQGLLTLDAARQEAIDMMSSFHYGNNDYLYLCDYSANFIYHPDPQLNGTDGSLLKDVNGRLVMPPLIERALESGSGYYDYWWPRLGGAASLHKLTYSQNLPEWGWVIGSGVYLDDVEREIITRQKMLIADLREFVRGAKIAEHGYLYIFDGDLNMIIHPNDNIEETNFAELINPLSGKSIGKELMAAAHSSDKQLLYRWDKPSDPGHYVYPKLAWVRYMPQYDYYVTASVYVDDLQSEGQLLARRLVQITIFTILLLTILGAALIYNVTRAIKKLAMVANKIVGGDLSEKVKIDRTDEIGQLGASFNQMVDNLKEQISTLEARVVERTLAQSRLVAQLEQSNVETTMLKNANEMLQECRNEEEVFQAVRIIMRKAFPATSGSLLSLVDERQQLEVVSTWNMPVEHDGHIYPYDACFAMRRGSTYLFVGNEHTLPCPHLDDIENNSICTPISAYRDTFGILHMQYAFPGDDEQEHIIMLVEQLAEYIAYTLAGLRLRNRLKQQSIRDPLTGLYNRRYMDEILHQEETRANRNSSQVGIMMLDVDHFKIFNDKYGHESGDNILRVLGKILSEYFRDSDVVCRYGGEEFIVILPDISVAQCQSKAEQLRCEVEDSAYIMYQNERIAITLSVGVALYPVHGDKIRSVIKQADDALYQAKANGRNMVVCAEV